MRNTLNHRVDQACMQAEKIRKLLLIELDLDGRIAPELHIYMQDETRLHAR
jgi:hypothetical protein